MPMLGANQTNDDGVDTDDRINAALILVLWLGPGALEDRWHSTSLHWKPPHPLWQSDAAAECS
jgi:hypothetical protein